jgi:YARHG domain
MKLLLSAAMAAGLLVALPSMAFAESCYQLWYERNAIYDDYGYCFSTALGRQTFDNSDCYTRYPDLSYDDQQTVAYIQSQEKAKHCHVN